MQPCSAQNRTDGPFGQVGYVVPLQRFLSVQPYDFAIFLIARPGGPLPVTGKEYHIPVLGIEAYANELFRLYAETGFLTDLQDGGLLRRLPVI